MDGTGTTTPAEHTFPLHAAAADAMTNLIEGVISIDRAIANLQAKRVRTLHEAMVWSGFTHPDESARSSQAFRSLRAELACATRVPERTAERQLAESESLVSALPATLAALSAGDISYHHAQVLVDAVTTLDPEQAAALEAAALPFGPHLTSAKFARKARILREGLSPDCAPQRHLLEVEKREVQVTPAQDGMAWLSAYLPAAEAFGIYHRLTDIARSWQRSGEDSPSARTLTQRRADALRDLLLDGEVHVGTVPINTVPINTVAGGTPRLPIHFGIRPKVFLTVPVLALLGHTDEPAILDGYGPIDVETARELTAHAPSFIRLLTSPHTGAVLDVGRDSYRVPADLKNWLLVRDGTCRFPGCSRAAVHSDLDHTDDWAFGNDTCHNNLAHLRKMHHAMKHASAWKVAHAGRDRGLAPGTLAWTSPLGRRYMTEPATVMRV